MFAKLLGPIVLNPEMSVLQGIHIKNDRNSDKHLGTFTQTLLPPIGFTGRRCSDFIVIISGRDYILNKRLFGS